MKVFGVVKKARLPLWRRGWNKQRYGSISLASLVGMGTVGVRGSTPSPSSGCGTSFPVSLFSRQHPQTVRGRSGVLVTDARGSEATFHLSLSHSVEQCTARWMESEFTTYKNPDNIMSAEPSWWTLRRWMDFRTEFHTDGGMR